VSSITDVKKLKTVLQRKLNPKRKASKDERPPMKALVENCLTPPKRQRIDGHVDVEASCSKVSL
jgi:hypothetical protein